jgi:hypothetical protein
MASVLLARIFRIVNEHVFGAPIFVGLAQTLVKAMADTNTSVVGLFGATRVDVGAVGVFSQATRTVSVAAIVKRDGDVIGGSWD